MAEPDPPQSPQSLRSPAASLPARDVAPAIPTAAPAPFTGPVDAVVLLVAGVSTAAAVAKGAAAAEPQGAPAAPLESLDGVLLTNVLCRLDAASLSRLAGTSTRLRTAAKSQQLWKSLVERDFLITIPRTPSPVGDDMHRLYTQTYANRSALAAAKVARRQRVVAVAKARRCGARARRCLDCLQFPCGLGLMGAYLFVALLLASMRILGNAAVPWGAPMGLLLVALCQPVFCAALGAVTEAVGDTADETSWAWNLHEGDVRHNWVAYAASLKRWLTSPDTRARGCRFGGLMTMLVTGVMGISIALAKLEGSIATGWALSLLPVWIFIGGLCTFPLWGLPRESSALSLTCLIAVFTLPLLATLVALAIRADGADHVKLVFAMVPLYCLDLLILGIAVMRCCKGVRRRCRRGRFRHTGWRAFMWEGTALCTFVGIMLIPEVWPAVAELQGKEIPVGSALEVLHWLFAFFAVVVFGVAIQSCRKARESSFRRLYSREAMRLPLPVWRPPPSPFPAGVPPPNAHAVVVEVT